VAYNPKPEEPKSKLMTPEEEAQQIRIAQNKRPERLLTPEEEAQRVRIAKGSRPEAPPEIKPAAALKRMTSLKSAIARLNSGGSIDALLLAQIPEYAGLMASNDPAAKQEAIAQMQQEYDYVKGFAPKGAAASAGTKPTGKPLNQETAKFILENAGGDKELARKIAKEQGYSF
jgi:hypothetical protein